MHSLVTWLGHGTCSARIALSKEQITPMLDMYQYRRRGVSVG